MLLRRNVPLMETVGSRYFPPCPVPAPPSPPARYVAARSSKDLTLPPLVGYSGGSRLRPSWRSCSDRNWWRAPDAGRGGPASGLPDRAVATARAVRSASMFPVVESTRTSSRIRLPRRIRRTGASTARRSCGAGSSGGAAPRARRRVRRYERGHCASIAPGMPRGRRRACVRRSPSGAHEDGSFRQRRVELASSMDAPARRAFRATWPTASPSPRRVSRKWSAGSVTCASSA